MGRQFWQLESPSSLKRLAEWDGEKIDLETIQCPVNSMHQHPGKRLTDLSVVLPDPPIEDFIWTWQSECLMQDSTLEILRSRGLTGFDVKPVAARFAKSAERPPTLWELVVTGWAGMAKPDSGIRLDPSKSCAACGHLVYTGLLHPEQLIAEEAWDGSDFFMVWPLPRFVFVTERVVSTIREHGLTGVRILPATEFEPLPDAFTPGRLSYVMADDRARALGEPLGIY
jgi:hypothetical protein